MRVTDTKGYNGDSTNYRDIQCQHIASNTIRTRVGRDFYIGVSTNELRVTNNLFWNGGDTGYKPVRASLTTHHLSNIKQILRNGTMTL